MPRLSPPDILPVKAGNDSRRIMHSAFKPGLLQRWNPELSPGGTASR